MDIEHLRTRVQYEPDTGHFYWISGRKVGKRAGCLTKAGHRVLSVDKKLVTERRAAWALSYGKWPEGRVTQLNRDVADSRLCNLAMDRLEEDLSAGMLRRHVRYEPSTGKFFWLQDKGRRKAGAEAGWSHSQGYVALTVGKHRLFAHRAAHLYMTGEMPDAQIDHKNGVRDDNRWSNLRKAVQSQNSANMGKRKNNKSGFKGAYQNKNGRFISTIGFKGKTRYLGSFDTAEQAHAAYCQAASKQWDGFSRFD